MGRKGEVRLSSEGVAALKRLYQAYRRENLGAIYVNVEAFCIDVGVPKSTYYDLLSRKKWFEKATVQDKLKLFNVPNPDDEKYYEYEQESGSPHNIPHQITSFVGREREIEGLRKLLRQTRLLTLTGPAGIGKTRLAIALAEAIVCDIADGCWFVDLRGVTESQHIPEAVWLSIQSRVDKAPIHSTESTLLSVECHLKRLAGLLILDNCEHATSACRPLVERLLQCCPNLQILCTSRNTLEIPGEVIRIVGPLTVPPTLSVMEVGTELTDLMNRYDAVKLFCQRAVEVDDQFSTSPNSMQHVVRICREFEGHPIGLELVVQMLRTQPLACITGFDTRRQERLDALITISYDLLSEQERELFLALSIFAGGWTLEAAQKVCNLSLDADLIRVLLSQLVEKSLVVWDRTEDGHYSYLKIIRDFAVERCVMSGKEELLRARHADVYLSMADRAREGLRGVDCDVWLSALSRDKSNLDGALIYCLKVPGRTVDSLKFVAALQPFWGAFGLYEDARLLCGAAIAKASDSGDSVELADAHLAAGHIASLVSDNVEARRHFQTALEMSERMEHTRTKAFALGALAGIDQVQGNLVLSCERIEQSLELLRDSEAVWMKAALFHVLGIVNYEMGNRDRARELYRESLVLKKRVGNKAKISFLLHDLGNAAKDAGDYAEARRIHEDALASLSQPSQRTGRAMALRDLGIVALLSDDYNQAQTCFDESLALCRSLKDERGVATNLCNLAFLGLRQHKFDTARNLLRNSLAILLDMGDLPGTIRTMGWLAVSEAACGSAIKSVNLLGLQTHLRHEHNIAPIESEEHEVEQYIARFRPYLSTSDYKTALGDGAIMSLQALRQDLESTFSNALTQKSLDTEPCSNGKTDVR